jgi:hypothetical protein
MGQRAGLSDPPYNVRVLTLVAQPVAREFAAMRRDVDECVHKLSQTLTCARNVSVDGPCTLSLDSAILAS